MPSQRAGPPYSLRISGSGTSIQCACLSPLGTCILASWTVLLPGLSSAQCSYWWPAVAVPRSPPPTFQAAAAPLLHPGALPGRATRTSPPSSNPPDAPWPTRAKWHLEEVVAKFDSSHLTTDLADRQSLAVPTFPALRPDHVT